MERVKLTNVNYLSSVIGNDGTEYVAYIDESTSTIFIGRYTENGIIELDSIKLKIINVSSLSLEVKDTSIIVYIAAKVNSPDEPSQMYRHIFEDIIKTTTQLLDIDMPNDVQPLSQKFDELLAKFLIIEHTANNARHSAAISAKVTDLTATSLETNLSRLERKVVNVENNAISTLEAVNTAQQQEIHNLQALVLELTNKVNTLPNREYVETYVTAFFKEVDTMITSETSLIGYTPLMIETVLNKFKQAVGQYTLADIRLILTTYDKYAKVANINPYIIVAQMAHETDWTRSKWASRPYRNPAGYGVTGANSETQPKETDVSKWVERSGIWYEGFSFSRWDLAVQVHIGHILAYVYTDEQLTKEQKQLVSLSPRSRLIKRGIVSKLSELDGKWAVPGKGYGHKLALIAQALK